MIKRIIAYLKPPIAITIIRRYKITSGNVGELYVSGVCAADSLDTFDDYALSAYTIAHYGDFVEHKPRNVLYVNDKSLDGRRIDATIRNNWAMAI